MARPPRLNRDPGGYKREAQSARKNDLAAAASKRRRGTFELGTKSRSSSNAGVKKGGGSGQRRDRKGRFA